ncbi:uncharacterized protein G6M90_00g029160 [Metarhizium brunneum]|uniref:Phosphatidic acid phosphatase type 2/haloperoxidase domain-containing protein n=1 Tax=Metarhizium brunneum TaxID=500148 RepID=A0A7D5UU75_9HYPO|nr:hypothetical protein G6M90_00g029160 [Metarhizium brunneum]
MPSSGTVFSYTVDWAILIGLAVAGFIAGRFPPNKRPFSLHNPDISLPYKGHDTVSLGAAIYICATRWYDFQHHGLDIMSGFIIGAVSSVLGFRYYYQPVRVGTGVSWEPRAARSRESMPSCCSGGDADPFCLSGMDCIC